MTDDDLTILNLRNETIRSNRNYADIEMRRWRANLRVIAGLKACGLCDQHDNLLQSRVRYGAAVECKPSDFPALRRMFPQLKDTGAYDLEDANERTVRVWLDTGLVDMSDSWAVRLYYVRPLPDDGPCRVVYRDPEPQLVCGVT